MLRREGRGQWTERPRDNLPTVARREAQMQKDSVFQYGVLILGKYGILGMIRWLRVTIREMDAALPRSL